MENITENNKLIAEFMGFEKTKQGGLYISPDGFEWERFLDVENYILPNQFLFHSSWDWLMKVVEKIENLQDENSCAIYNVRIEQCFVEIIINHISETIVEVDSNSKIQAVYQACVEFIKWYNEQNKTNESL